MAGLLVDVLYLWVRSITLAGIAGWSLSYLRAPKTTKHVVNGWGIVLAGLKTLLEAGRPMPMPEPA